MDLYFPMICVYLWTFGVLELDAIFLVDQIIRQYP